MSETSNKVDILITSDWQYDDDFINLIVDLARKLGLSVLRVDHATLPEAVRRVRSGDLSATVLFDRASDTSPEFYVLQKLLAKTAHVLNPLKQMVWASDKATMHLEFINKGLHTPYTIIVESFNENNHVHFTLDELAHLGRPFIIKPANTTGGGIGVVDGAETLYDVLEARRQFKSDKYLLQEKVIPLEHRDKRFWFRGFYAFGEVLCAWWNDLTHRYKTFEPQDIEDFQLQPLFDMTTQIADICGLDFFSTEICLTSDKKFIVVDYVNEACDMRLQSLHADGVPDSIVHRIAEHFCAYVFALKKKSESSSGYI